MNTDSPPTVIKGTSRGQPASLTVGQDRLVRRSRRGQVHPEPEELDIPAERLTVFALRFRGWTTASTFGLFLVGLAMLWLVHGSISFPVAAALGLAGAMGIVAQRAFPEAWLTLRTPDSTQVMRVVRGSIRSCEEAVHRLQSLRPALAGVQPEKALPFFGRQFRTLMASNQALRDEFRRLGPAAGNAPLEEGQFVRTRKRMAIWVVVWLLVAPLVCALGVQLFLPPQPGFRLAVRVGLCFFLFVAIFLSVQGWLWKHAIRWFLNGGDDPRP